LIFIKKYDIIYISNEKRNIKNNKREVFIYALFKSYRNR
jgi:hypothetical protein